MTQYPETAHQSFKEKYRNIEWVNDKQQFDQWKNGLINGKMVKLDILL